MLVFRLGLVAVLFLVLPAAANAYTLVLRSGRHVTVPDDFKVTTAAVVYEASPGFSVTVWLSNIDFAATERVNAEPAGSFAGRIRRETAGVPVRAPQAAPAGRRAGAKVVTNKELEPLRLRREAQEEEYERTHKERGMPSRQELQRRVEEQDRRLREWAEEMEAERRAAELESLKSELVSVRRHLNELSLHLSRQAAAQTFAGDYPYFYAPPAQIITVLPHGRFGRFARRGFGLHQHGRPHLFHTRRPHHPTPIYVSPARALPRPTPPAVRPPSRPR